MAYLQSTNYVFLILTILNIDSKGKRLPKISHVLGCNITLCSICYITCTIVYYPYYVTLRKKTVVKKGDLEMSTLFLEGVSKIFQIATNSAHDL